ncbi:MAG TPA: BON domain-containing protein [Burkholderiales bacterium]|nr:BON domain-containing protein [Burkholderiales bacterium]
MKRIVPLAVLALLAACSESTPPPKPAAQAEPQAQSQPAAPKVEAPAPTPVAAQPEPPRPDPNKELAARVKQALEAPASKLPSGAIDVTAADGKVSLWGAVASAGERRRAAQLAGKVEGVKSVDNQLKIVRGS